MHSFRKSWLGNIVYADNHAEMTDSFFPAGVAFAPTRSNPSGRDNIFAAEFGELGFSAEANDTWLIMYEQLDSAGPVPLYDALD